jgi:hypothetical protein
MQINVKVHAGDRVEEWDALVNVGKLTVLKDSTGELVQVFASHNPDDPLLTNSEKRLLTDRLNMAIAVANHEQKPMTVNFEIGGF